MKRLPTPARYHAIALQLAAYLDERCVEMRILTNTGETIAVACPSDSIFAIQQHIERLGHDCPAIATWSRPKAAD